jgi:hypothetical protein
MSPPRPCRARLRLHAQTVSQSGSMLPEFPVSPLPCEKIHPFHPKSTSFGAHFVPLFAKQTTSSLLKFVACAGQARRKAAKKRNVWGNHEHFEPLSNAASPSAAEFQQTVRAC